MPPSSPTTGSVVATSLGDVAGTIADGVTVFRGVPYAQPPVGPLRFRPPVPVEPWDGVRSAHEFGPIAIQYPTPLEATYGTELLPQSEDCLTLNIWTPATDDAGRPVLVWIHGGAFSTGSGRNPLFDGSALARHHDVVVVTINYRLDVFGFLHLDACSDDEAGSGNAGLLDQIEALRWVRSHVSAFGGDPGAVTVFGESAGAMSIGGLLGVPAASGLFSRAILQSGAASSFVEAPAADDTTTRLLDHLGLPHDDAGLAAMRELPATDLLDASGAVQGALAEERGVANVGFAFGPVIDGDVVPSPPLEAIAAGSAADVELIVGVDLDEMEILRVHAPGFFDLDAAGETDLMAALLGPLHEAGTDLYRQLVDDDRRSPVRRSPATLVMTDLAFVLPAYALVDAHHGSGGRSRTYLFAWHTRADEARLGAYHTLEMAFVFGTLGTDIARAMTGVEPDEVAALGSAMRAAWVGFARSGDPNHSGLPHWPLHEPVTSPTMVFDTTPEVVADPWAERRRFWTATSG